MSSVPEGNRYAPPTAHVEDILLRDGSGLELAGRGARLGAAIIDSMILLAALWIVGFLTPYKPLDPDMPDTLSNMAIGSAVSYGLFLLIQGLPLAMRSQTLGKIAMDIKVVRSDGSKASFVRLAGLRYLPGVISTLHVGASMAYALIDSLLIFRASRKCLHDNIADTIVIQA